jgi:hypothetical protein
MIKIEARGRNGWFKVDRVDVLVSVSQEQDPVERVSCVDVYSGSKVTRTAPIMFVGTRDELLKLFEDIAERLRNPSRGGQP